MAKFRFAQEKQITTWVRDYYEIEADSLDEAVAIVTEADTSLDVLESEDDRVKWKERDSENSMQWTYEDNSFPTKYSISSCDDDEEIISR
jgi:hypothetical protein